MNVKVVICDQGSNNRSMLQNHIGVNVDKHYFMYNGKRILAMYDPPHLLKNIRNNLKSSGYAFGEDKVAWQYIVDFYNRDSKLPIRMAPKVSKKHIDLSMFSKLSVKLAAHILSHSDAAGITTLVSLGAIPEKSNAHCYVP